MGTPLYNFATKATEEIPDDQVAAAVAGGSHAFDASAQVPAINPDGQAVTIPATRAAEAFAQGFKYLPPGALQQLQEQEKYGDTAGEVKSAGLGLARGATLGLSDLLAKDTGAMSPAELKGYAEANPLASGAGHVAGLLLPALASDGASVEAEGAAGAAEGGGLLSKGLGLLTAPARGISKVGDVAASAVEGLGIEGLPGQALAGAARGAVEAPLYQAGDNLSEDVFDNKELTGESLAAHMGPSMLMGAAGGAAAEGLLGIAERKVPKLLEDASSSLDRLSKRLGGAAEDVSPEAVAGAQRDFRGAAQKAYTDTEKTLRTFHQEDKPQLVNYFLGRSNKAAPMVDEITSGAARTLAEAEGPVASTGRQVLARLQGKLEDASSDAERFTAIDRAKQELDTALADKFGKKVQLTPLDAVASDSVRQVAGDFRDALTNDTIFGGAAAYQREVNAALAPYYQARTELQRQGFIKAGGKFKSQPMSAYTKGVARGEAGYDDRVQAMQGFADAAKGALEGIQRTTYDVLPEGRNVAARAAAFGDMRAAQDKAVAKQVAQYGSKSNTDTFGGIFAHVAGYPGAFPLAMLKKAAGIFQSGSAQSQVVSTVAATAAKVTDSMAKGVRSALQGAEGKGATLAAIGAGTTNPKEARATFTKDRKQILQAQANPQATAAQVGANLPALSRHAPQTAAALTGAATRAQQYLAQALPKDPNPPSMFPGSPKWSPSDAEVQRYALVKRSVEEPLSILDDMKAGTLTDDQVKAVAAVYPQLYSKMQAVALEEISNSVRPPNYQQRLQLSKLLGQNVDPSQGMLAQLQAPVAPELGGSGAGPKAPGPNVKGLSKLTASKQAALPTNAGGLK